MPGPPRVLIGAADTNGPIKREHLPDWLWGGGASGVAARSQPNYPSGMPERHAGEQASQWRKEVRR